MDLVFRKSLRDTSRKSRTQVLVAVYSEAQRARCIELSEELRSHGLSVEVFFTSPKLGKQIDYAASKGIPRVLFVEPETGVIEAKNLETKEQVPVNNLAEWCRSNFFASE